MADARRLDVNVRDRRRGKRALQTGDSRAIAELLMFLTVLRQEAEQKCGIRP